MKPEFSRIVLVVLDGFGVGELPDASKFSDEGSNTLGALYHFKPQLKIPNLQQLGLNLQDGSQRSLFATKMKEISAGKDTTTGHWEMMSLPVSTAFDFFPNGFPKEMIDEFCYLAKLPGVLGNKPASGTEIIKELGEEHLKTLKPIIYTSADSVFQIAAHEESFGLKRLYEISEIAREMFNKSEWTLGRVIARPFIGNSADNFKRTTNRKDFSLKPHGKTTLTELQKKGVPVVGFGKIPSIYAYEGIDESISTGHDNTGLKKLQQVLKEHQKPGLLFLNLNDLDTLYGHRRDVQGYAEHLEKLDEEIPSLLASLKEDDLLMIVSDHGNDPSFKGTDHTREFVPLITYSKSFKNKGPGLATRESFCDVGATILDNFKASPLTNGISFLEELKKVKS